MRISGWSSDVCSSDLEDRNFQNRLAPPPALAVGPYADRPQARPDDWAGIVRPTDSRLGIAGDNEAMAEDEGGLQHQRHPGLEEKADKAAPDKQPDPAEDERDDSDAATAKREMDRVRNGMVRGHAKNQIGRTH